MGNLDSVDNVPMKAPERGATAVLVALSLILLLGVAAVALDLSAGFNERSQDQNAADNAVMAGALDLADRLQGGVASASVLAYALPNITADFIGQTDTAWIEMWRSCTDDGNPNWVPLPEPAAWSGIGTASNPTGSSATLDCISRTTSLLRVRVPDQLVDTTFGQVLGFDSIATNAVAIAKLENQLPAPPLVPYGIPGSASAGEQCFGSASSGTAYPPCFGPSAGTFGTLLSELFGDFYGDPDCGNPTSTNSIRITTAVGIDHELEEWSGAGTVPVPTPHPGDNVVLARDNTNRDACVLDPDGNAAPLDGLPINTVTVDSGFPSNEMEAGLVSDETFFGVKSRLQRYYDTDQTRDVVKVRTGNETVWTLDNTGPWEFLVANGTAIGECNPDYYEGLDTEQKVKAFDVCLQEYEDLNGTPEPIFTDDLDSSPRFVWVPQYAYELPTTGLSYQPIRGFKMAFIGGVYFNCNGNGCAVVFYPDADETAELCDFNPNSGNCASLSLDQFSAFLLPDDAVPEAVKKRFRDALDTLEPVLWQ